MSHHVTQLSTSPTALMGSVNIWDNGWVPSQLSTIVSYLQEHSTIQLPPLSGLPLQIFDTCQAGFREWEVYSQGLIENREKGHAGISDESPSLSAPRRFLELPAQRMFQTAFLGLLRTRLAFMWSQYGSGDPTYLSSITIPPRPQGPSDHKRKIDYWVKECRLALLDYSPKDLEAGFLASLTQRPHGSDGSTSTSSNSGQLLEAAVSLETLASQCQMGANILYAAWGLRRILESPSDFLVSFPGEASV
jgi:hypothetical protein